MRLKDVIEQSIHDSADLNRARALLRLLPKTGDIETLVDLADDEFFHEFGLTAEFEQLLGSVASDQSARPRDRFWALDALSHLDHHHNKHTNAALKVAEMERLLPEIELRDRETATLRLRQMTTPVGGLDRAGLDRLYEDALDNAGGDAPTARVIKYTYAVALDRLGEHGAAEDIAWDLVQQHYDLLGLEVSDVFAVNPPEIAEKLGDRNEHRAELKHLADSLVVYANARNRQGNKSGVARIHAMKFYDLAYAPSSVVRTAMDVVDEFIGLFNDAPGARDFIENTMLPTVARLKLLDYLVPVEAQYAVVLAYCGEIEEAQSKINELESFKSGMSEYQLAEIENQRRAIEDIAGGRVRLRPVKAALRPEQAQSTFARTSAKIGRNERCPCGSGKKYKRCHGR